MITPRRKSTRLIAWAVQHDSHGLSWDTLVFLPEGDLPETDEHWVRLEWLDEPER